ncbi:hypothetical protein ACFVJS_05900 [Nocardioides sp. NPDC057772]
MPEHLVADGQQPVFGRHQVTGVGIALRGPRKAVDRIVKGARFHD